MKGSLLPVVALLAATSFSLYGCGADENPSLTTFLSLHNQFCESDVGSREALTAALELILDLNPLLGLMGSLKLKLKVLVMQFRQRSMVALQM